MSNQYGIPKEVEQRIRLRYKECVYCHKTMAYPCVDKNRCDWATVEHLKEDGG